MSFLIDGGFLLLLAVGIVARCCSRASRPEDGKWFAQLTRGFFRWQNAKRHW